MSLSSKVTLPGEREEPTRVPTFSGSDSPEAMQPGVDASGAELGSGGFSFLLRGLGSVLEILPPPWAYLPEEEDAEAIQRDWEAVGADLWAAIHQMKHQPR